MALGSDTGSNDISVKLMNHLWSDEWYNIGVTAGTAVNDNQFFVYKIMLLLNTFVLAAVVILFIWTTWVGVTGTAHEGVPLGRRFSTVWVPFRAAIGISFVAPIFSGLSILQIVLLQLVVTSINFANVVNDEFLTTFVSANPSGHIQTMVTLGNIPGLEENAQAVGGTIFKSLIIQEYYTEVGGYSLRNAGQVYVTSSVEGGLSTKYQFSSPQMGHILDFLAGKYMAHTTVVCDDTGTLCTAKNTAMATLINQLRPIAEQYVRLKQPGLTGSDLTTINNAYHTAITNYISAISTATMGNLDPTTEFGQQTTDFISDVTNRGKGWLALGSYYWILSNASQKALAEAGKLPQSKWADLNSLEEFIISGGDLAAMLDAAEPVVNTIYYLGDTMETFGPEGSLIRNIFSWPADRTTEWFLQHMAGVTETSNKDVITNLQTIGHTIILAGNTVMTGVFFNDSIRNKLVKWIGKATGGSLLTKPDDGESDSVIMLFLVKVLILSLIVLFLLYPMGIMLAYYLPMIPLLIWILAGINWVIGTFSIMLGAPLWAAAHSLPDGEGFAGARGQEGYMLVLNVLLRPALMVIGFFIAFMGIRMMGVFLYELFHVASLAMSANFSRGIVTILANVFLFGMIIIVCAQKIFSLIVYFPDIVLNYIGKYIPGQGEGGDVQKINSMFDRVKSQATPRLGR